MGKKQIRQVTREEMKEYGEFFKLMRLSINYSLQRMAAEIGIFYTSLSKWEKGVSIPQQDIYEIESRIRNIVKLAKLNP